MQHLIKIELHKKPELLLQYVLKKKSGVMFEKPGYETVKNPVENPRNLSTKTRHRRLPKIMARFSGHFHWVFHRVFPGFFPGFSSVFSVLFLTVTHDGYKFNLVWGNKK